MTDEDQAKILSVTSKLTGEFYVGQRVMDLGRKRVCTVRAARPELQLWVLVVYDNGSTGYLRPDQMMPV